MVTFVCDNCNSSLRKNQVISHRCGSVFACITCGELFNKSNYKNHNNCISEAEKYQGSDYKPKDNENKGDTKQKCWSTIVSEALDNYQTKNHNLRRLIDIIKVRDNIPQKEKKFINFISAMPQSKYIPNCATLLWNTLVAHKEKLNQITQAAKRPIADNTTSDEPATKKAKTDQCEVVKEEVKESGNESEVEGPRKKEKKSKSKEIQIIEEKTEKPEIEAPKKKKKKLKSQETENIECEAEIPKKKRKSKSQKTENIECESKALIKKEKKIETKEIDNESFKNSTFNETEISKKKKNKSKSKKMEILKEIKDEEIEMEEPKKKKSKSKENDIIDNSKSMEIDIEVPKKKKKSKKVEEVKTEEYCNGKVDVNETKCVDEDLSIKKRKSKKCKNEQ